MNPYKNAKSNKWALPTYEKDLDLRQQIMYYALIVIFAVGVVGVGGLILIH